MNNSPKISSHYMQRAKFEMLTVQQFYLVAKLRQDVFIVEQQSIYTDLDGLDQEAMHYLYWSSSQIDAELIGYARYRQLPSANDFQIERVVFSPAWRGKGIGTLIMRTMLQDIKAEHQHAQIKLSAQIEAKLFYHKLGFLAEGESYVDGGIEHITMYYQV
ncbi:GNAT family N-acetyltransferase [Paraglaciecola sp. 25GB23A]|uniref:GNAT family N-acetyltransferase n=1 Tax=Paraglaciecola sp. 25GB23A TaxID=3156068 RepID=UPI0032AFC4BA